MLHGGAPDKQVKKYSGGMRRRLSVAISLIGDAKVLLFTKSNISTGPQVVTADTLQLRCRSCTWMSPALD